MARLRALLLLALLPAVCACGATAGRGSGGVVRAADPRAAPAAPAGDAAALQEGNDGFAGRLLALLARSHPTVTLSPYGISEALSMVFAGARGETASQMASALGFRLPTARLAAAFNAVAQRLAGSAGPEGELREANALYGQRGQQFAAPFLGLLAREYGAGMRTVDFERATEAALATINRWVAEQTAGRIPELLGAGDVDDRTRLVVVNAVYLRARWQFPFKASGTQEAPFHAPGATVNVPTMHQTGSFGYTRGAGYQALELPYQGGRLAFDILLPDPGRLDALLAQLAHGGALPLLRGLAPQRVEIAVPKLRLDTKFELAGALRALGMPLAFDPGGADLSGIAGPPGYLYIQAVVHQAYLNVDETGTEAAAATGVSINATAVFAPPRLRFIVDRPFVFVLRDVQTGAVLFEGVVSRP